MNEIQVDIFVATEFLFYIISFLLQNVHLIFQ